jgi:hypothetical protein
VLVRKSLRSQHRRTPFGENHRSACREATRQMSDGPQPLDPFILAWIAPQLFLELPSFERPRGIYGEGKHMPRRAAQQMFWGNGTVGASWETWVKPRNASMIAMICIGGGGGGGGGLTAATTTAKGGGGGGGSAGTGKALYPAGVLPGTFYMQSGIGGKGSTGTGVAGSIGSRACIGDYPNINASNLMLISDSTAAGGGAAGTAAGSQAGGAAAGVASIPALAYSTWAFSVAGIGGSTGGAGAALGGNAPAVSSQNGTAYSSGTGGGSSSAANAVGNGGNITQTAGNWLAGQNTTVLLGGTGVAGGPGNPGVTGVCTQSTTLPNAFVPMTPLICCGGTGGGSSATAGAGGVGGNAAGFGSGGGGGGAGVAGAAGGNGSGTLIIICWW